MCVVFQWNGKLNTSFSIFSTCWWASKKSICFWRVGSKATSETISYTLDLQMALSFNCKPFALSTKPNTVEGKVTCLLLEASKLSLLSLFFFAHAITLDILLCHVSTSHLVLPPQCLSFIVFSPKIHLAQATWQLNREILKLLFCFSRMPSYEKRLYWGGGKRKHSTRTRRSDNH